MPICDVRTQASLPQGTSGWVLATGTYNDSFLALQDRHEVKGFQPRPSTTTCEVLTQTTPSDKGTS